MARKPIRKELKNTRLLKDYASWIYCTSCEKTVAYLCYVTYDRFDFKFVCKCGNAGEVHICFDEKDGRKSEEPLTLVKNRLCCPNDASPLLTIVDKNLQSYAYSILCNACGRLFSAESVSKDS